MSMEYAALANAISDVRTTADDLDRGRTTLHQSFGSFLGDGWTGQAAESFRGGWDDWAAGVASVLDALQSIASLLEDHGRDLQAHDGGTELTMTNLQARLGGSGETY
jgi:WXG100 family type VII secretion target